MSKRLAAALLAVFVASAPAAFAEGMGGDHQGKHEHHHAMCQGTGGGMMVGWLNHLLPKLNLTDAQKPAWTKLTDALTAAHQPVAAACAQFAGQPAPATLPDRLARMQAMQSAHATAMQTAIPAIVEFYNGLTPDQKKVMDAGHDGHRPHGGHKN